jgi:hypothetical protein
MGGREIVDILSDEIIGRREGSSEVDATWWTATDRGGEGCKRLVVLRDRARSVEKVLISTFRVVWRGPCSGSDPCWRSWQADC